AGRLWQVCLEASRLLAERARLVAALRAEAEVPAYAAGAAAPAAQVPAYAGKAAAPQPPVVTPAPRPEWTPRRVQNLLLALGVGLLGVAAVIFVAVSWGRLGVGGRAAVMTGVTALAAYAGLVVHRRGLTATAEALSLLTVGLALIDCAGARASDLLGLRDTDALLFAAGTAGLVAIAAAAGSLALPTRALRLSAAVLAQLPLPLVLVHAADRVDQPAALLAAGLTAQAVAAVAVVAGWPGGRRSLDARVAVASGGGLTALLATALAAGAAYGEDGSLVVGSALLIVIAVGSAVAAETVALRSWAAAMAPLAGLPVVLRAASAALVVGAAWAPVVDGVPSRWLAPALSATALALLALSALVPADRRPVPAVVLLASVCAPALDAVRGLVISVAGRLQWPERAWSAEADSTARDLLANAEPYATWSVPSTLLPSALVLASVAVALLVAALLTATLRPAALGAVPVAAGAALMVVPGADGSYAVALAADLLSALVSLTGGVWLLRSRRPGLGAAAMLSGAAVLALAVSWSLAVDVATLCALPASAAVALTVLLMARGIPALRGVTLAAGVCAALLLVAEAAAGARYSGAGWPAVTALVLTLLAASGLVASLVVAVRADRRDPLWEGARRAFAVVGLSAALADAGAVAWWQGADAAGAGLAVTVAAAVVLAASTVPLPSRLVDRADLQVVAGLAAGGGLLAGVDDPDRLWVALLAAGVGVAVLGIRQDHRWGWLSGLLLVLSSWVRLALSDVTAPEAYTVPAAVGLLAVGAWRRHRDPEYRSWPAYAPGLGLALVPSLLRAVTDAGNLRPLLLGLAALTVLLLGVARRLQAPLLIGGSVLAVDALVQLAPYLVAVYDVVPRWVTIGLAGLLLLGAGATYEQRVHDLRRVGRHVARLG
ncbi:MAG TPA: hypothetical protein VF227_06695, partial [Actinomycetes bacterium]